jgi:hypothetical protein
MNDGASGNALSASTQFDLSASTLTVTLTNTATSAKAKYVPSKVLMVVYFGSASLVGLTPKNREFLGGFSPVRVGEWDWRMQFDGIWPGELQ